MNQRLLTAICSVFLLLALITGAFFYIPGLTQASAEERKTETPAYRYRETDDRMGGSIKSKATMQRYKEDEEAPVKKTSSSTPKKTVKKEAVAPTEAEKKPDESAQPETSTENAAVNEAQEGENKSAEETAVDGEAADTPAETADAEITGDNSAEQEQSGTAETEPQQVNADKKATRIPATLKVNFTDLESLGTLRHSASGSLGIDLWDGSSRKQILELVNQLPSPRYYAVLQRMNQRALLTSSDATLMENRGSIQAGEDFQTIRIEKLLDSGSYLQASQLYMADPAIAYHERLARAGVQSLFFSHQPTVACLETKTMYVRFNEQPFWQQASAVCDFILGKMAGKNLKKFTDDPEIKAVTADSKVLGYVFDKLGYKVTPRKIDDLKDYTPIELALLLNDNRIVLGKLDLSDVDTAPSHAIGLLMMVQDTPAEIKLPLWDSAVRRGMITPAELGSYYSDIKLESKDRQKAKGWMVLPAYYQAYSAARDKDQKKKLAHEALSLASEYPPSMLTPFAEHIATLSDENMGPQLVQNIARIGLIAGAPLSPALEKNLWNQAESGAANNQALRLAIANAALQNFSTEEMPKAAIFQELTGKLPETSKTLVFKVIEKLDTANKLHNISPEEVYEKQDGLTAPNNYDYVMPSSDLMESLVSAQKDQRLGEVILLSSIALGDIPPSKLDPAVLAEVIDGLKTVGLTSEARELASEAIMGLSKGK